MEKKHKSLNCAKEYCLYLLEKCMKTKMEIVRKLRSKDYDEDVIEKAIEFLEQYSFVDDEAYTEAYIKEKIEKQSLKKIKYDLIKKGIDKNIINEKLSNSNEDCEYKSACIAANKKYQNIKLKEESNDIIRKKLFDFLARKGYAFEVIKKVINEVMDTID